jgi:signal transduction histidine kinase/CheY-like chemotaxis protein
VHPDDRARLVELQRSVHAGEPQDGSESRNETEYRFLRGDGSYAYILDRWVAARDEHGDVVRIVGGMVDVTHQRALEGRLQQAQKMEALGRLAGGVAHDFNNLLTAILGNAELIRLAPPGDETWREDVGEIVRAAERAGELTGRLLTFSRDGGSTEDTADVDATIEEMTTMLGRLLREDIELELELAGTAAHVGCDAAQLEQVVLNLALNAHDAMPGGGRLRIETGLEGDDVRLAVSDTGTGMSDEVRQRIFEPFFTTKQIGKGTGLGLATVYGVVERAGGSIAVHSSPGAGTTFELLLPRRGASDAPSVPGGTTPTGGAETILVVEDEDSVRAVAVRMLEESGYNVVPASSGTEALELFADDAFHPDLIVSDVVMPHLSGFELAHRLTELRPRVRFVFMTGFAGATDGAEGLEDHPVVRKPFTTDDFVGTVRRMLEPPFPRPG